MPLIAWSSSIDRILLSLDADLVVHVLAYVEAVTARADLTLQSGFLHLRPLGRTFLVVERWDVEEVGGVSADEPFVARNLADHAQVPPEVGDRAVAIHRSLLCK